MRRGVAGETRPPVVAEVRESDPTNPNLNPTADADEFSAMHHRYFIYEAVVDGSWVRQLTGGPDDPMTTPNDLCTVLIEDADPCYLPAPADATTSANAIPVGCTSAASTIRRCCTESRAKSRAGR